MVAFCNSAVDGVERRNFPNAARPGRLHLYRFAALDFGIIDGLVRSHTGNVPIRRAPRISVPALCAAAADAKIRPLVARSAA